jgi:hypothetical protein
MKTLKLFLFFFLIISCSSSKNQKEGYCQKTYINNYSKISFKKLKSINESDTIFLNELRFECVSNPFLSHKIMFEKFGLWNNSIYKNSLRDRILIWENVDIFDNGEKYNVATHCNDDDKWQHNYCSVMVFDQYNNDLLDGNSQKRDKIIDYFSNAIKNDNSKEDRFRQVFERSFPNY